MPDEHSVTLHPPVWALIAAVALAGGFYLVGKNMEQSTQEMATISVTGEGKISAAPNIAELSFGVQTGPQKTAKEAMDMLTEDMTAAFDAVKALGVEEKDIRTQSLYLNPVYDWTNNRQTLRGYEANQSLIVKIRDLDKVSDVLSAATGAGANQSGGVSFTIDDPETLRAQARQEAIEQAKDKAEDLADELDASLGRLRGFNEGYGGYMPPMPYYSRGGMGVAEDAAATNEAMPPIPAGEQEIVVNVTLTYELN